MSIHVTAKGVFVDGRQVEPGWHKLWICENAYGWRWFGPFRFADYVDLIVLDYEPGEAEREAIVARFKDARPPNGEAELKTEPKKGEPMNWQMHDTGFVVSVRDETDVNDAGRMFAPPICELSDRDGSDYAYARRNGQAIVRAVNSHDRLVNVLTRCINALGNTPTSPLERANVLRDARRELAYARTGVMSELWRGRP